VAGKPDADVLPAHRVYMRRQLHPLVLCAPFAYRAYAKPLGYAGDYEMVNIILRDDFEGASLFAKLLNFCFVRQPPALAHRNRVDYLVQALVQESSRVGASNRTARVLNLGCGPAVEVQRFLAQHELSNHTDFALLDFN